MTDLERLEREAETQPSPPPRDPWWVIAARQEQLAHDWLPPRVRQPRDRKTGRYVKEKR